MLDVWYKAGMPDGSRKVFRFQYANNRMNASDIRDYEWAHEDRFQKVRQFYKELTTKSIPVVFFQRLSGPDGEMYDRAEAMYEMFDRDVRMKAEGKLWFGKYDDDESKWQGYWINCYVIGSSKVKYDNGKIIKLNLTVLSDFRWHKIVCKEFGAATSSGGGGEPQEQEFLDFEYDFQYDYSTSALDSDTRRIASDSVAPFDFRIEFEGPIENPELQVGDQIYKVFTSVGQYEQLVIDSVERKVYRRNKVTEEITNEFNNRDRDNYIFEPMPVTEGNSTIIWPEGHITRLYAYIERSEPEWI